VGTGLQQGVPAVGLGNRLRFRRLGLHHLRPLSFRLLFHRSGRVGHLDIGKLDLFRSLWLEPGPPFLARRNRLDLDRPDLVFHGGFDLRKCLFRDLDVGLLESGLERRRLQCGSPVLDVFFWLHLRNDLFGDLDGGGGRLHRLHYGLGRSFHPKDPPAIRAACAYAGLGDLVGVHRKRGGAGRALDGDDHDDSYR
jgi:hypothetical protein